MANNIFCNNCGNALKLEDSKCSCGNVMSIEVKNEMASKVSNIENSKLIVSKLSNKVAKLEEELYSFKLDKKYLIADSIKNDYENKIYFIKEDLLPAINKWKDKVEKADTILANDKVELYGRILGVTDFIISDFYGRFMTKSKEFEVFAKYRDFSRYELTKVMKDHNIELDDIQTVNFGTIGIDVFNAIGDTLHNGSFLELSEKDNISDSELNGVKAELGFAVATELISGISNLIGQNSDAIRNVREADSKLNGKLKHISNVSNSLRIEEQEINKDKQLFDKSDYIIDICYTNILKPIVEAFQNDPTFLEYKKLREPFDLQQDKVEIENQALKVNVKVSFWGCLLRTSKSNFNSNLNKRLNYLNSKEKYLDINSILKEKLHKSLKSKLQYDIDTIEKFKEFEKTNRRILRKLPIVVENNNTVVKFLGVLKQVKKNITK